MRTNQISLKLQAIDKSINKWKQIKDGTEFDKGRKNCALCQKYTNCKGCPVKEFSGEPACEGTPYLNWCNHASSYHRNDINYLSVLCKTCEELAQKEIDFLKRIRKWVVKQEGKQ